jgi:hypothetical protein
MAGLAFGWACESLLAVTVALHQTRAQRCHLAAQGSQRLLEQARMVRLGGFYLSGQAFGLSFAQQIFLLLHFYEDIDLAKHDFLLALIHNLILGPIAVSESAPGCSG